MTFVRTIGRWAMTGLVINSIIGSGIFGVPSELIRLLGRASPLAMVFAALIMAVIMASIAEVASQFTEPGGPYLYLRTAFGRFAGLLIGWFWLLAVVGGGAASANLFVDYLAGIVPGVSSGILRLLTMTVLIAIPAAANYRGVRSGTNLSSLLAVSKLLPLGILIALGVVRFAGRPELIRAEELFVPGAGAWMTALLLLLYSYGGYEDALAPTGEVKEPRRTVPFALAAGLAICAVVYTLLQFVTVLTTGLNPGERPVVNAASVLIGSGGMLFVSIAVMISTYGWLSAGILNAPRLTYSFAQQGDFPAFLGKLHPKYRTPWPSILLYAFLTWILGITGSFLWALMLSAGSMMVLYGGVCAALIRLRKMHPDAPALRVPFGPLWASLGIVICIVLLTRLQAREALMMGITGLIAAANFLFVHRRDAKAQRHDLCGREKKSPEGK